AIFWLQANGPMSYMMYMQLCLSHPTEGYYMNLANVVIGAQGNFITSPEISQTFAELLGIWLLSQYLRTGVKDDIQLVELGPGKGMLMDNIFWTLLQLPCSHTSIKHVHLVESSPSLCAIQQKKLESWDGKNRLRIHWHHLIDDVPVTNGIYTMLVAHKFFDVLPFHLIEKTHQGWKEVLLTSAHNLAAKTIIKPSSSASATPSLDPSASTPKTCFHIASLWGVKLVYWVHAGLHGTLYFVDTTAGADLTANVDFAYLTEALKGTATAYGPLLQHSFLLQMGLSTHVNTLQCAAAFPECGKLLSQAAAHLMEPIGMGKEYKVMGMTGSAVHTADAEGMWPFVAGEIWEEDAAALQAQQLL
ncbi:S-adenosyl-L-methionine-dependent methyltransferase, partial [Lactarius tabidus]